MLYLITVSTLKPHIRLLTVEIMGKKLQIVTFSSILLCLKCHSFIRNIAQYF